MRLEEFVSRFCLLEMPVESDSATGRAITLQADPVEGYVAPTITAMDWPDNASAVLVEAPGAVGKSAAARAIASRLNWPIVHSEHAQVGSYSLSGVIQDVIGFSSPFLQQVAAGQAGIVIDSLDEAHFKAGTENFLAFMENVAKVSGTRPAGGSASPSVVLMSRSDAAELVKLSFADAGVPLATVRLDFFDRKEADQFISAYLRQRFEETDRGEYNVALASQRPFELLRERRFKQLAAALVGDAEFDLRADWPRVANFLGYAPVLVAMAESMAVRNPTREPERLDASDQVALLREIVEHILRREQMKFEENLGPKLSAFIAADSRVSMPSDLYSPEEQVARLIAYIRGEELATSLPAGLPAEVKPIYDDAARNFLPDHPFLRGRNFASVVFADYARAVSCVSLGVRLGLRFRPEETIGSPGPFFARFLADPGRSDRPPVVDEALVEAIIFSWNQESDLVDSAYSEVRVVMLENEGTISCVREPGGRRSEASDVPELEFSVTGLTGALHIKNPLKRATVVSEQSLILGEAGGTAQVGPSVVLMAAELVTDAEVLRVESNKGRTFGLAIAADEIVANRLGKVESGSAFLAVYSANPPSRLRPYARSLGTQNSMKIPFQFFMDLRTMLLAFKSSTTGDGKLAVLAAKLDNKIIKASANRQALFRYLSEIDAITRDGPLYLLDLTVLGRYGFGVQDLRSGEPSESVLRFMANVRSGSGMT